MDITIQEAIRLLSSGHVVALPTETVYGLAASIEENGAIEKIFLLKNRPALNPLIVHVRSTEEALKLIEPPPSSFFTLAENFWPGPLTMILDAKKSETPDIVRANLASIAIRVPKHAIMRAILEETAPLVAPSANLSTRPSGTEKEHILHDFGKDFPVVDGGSTQYGLESTILAYKNGVWVVARKGALAEDAFFSVLGYKPQPLLIEKNETIISPGQLLKHYAPNAKLLLLKKCSHERMDCVIGFKERSYSNAEKIILLGSLKDPENVAKNLYSALRRLDLESIPSAFVDMDIPENGLWLTIRERLEKAASSQ